MYGRRLLRSLKIDLTGELFALLREHGLMRTNQDIDTQRYILNAVQTRFYLYEPLTATSAPRRWAIRPMGSELA